MPLETLHQATYQNTTISQISGLTSICPNTVVIHTSTRIVQHLGHLQLWWIHNNICHTIAEFKPTTDTYTLQKKFTTFSWRCPQLAHWNSHHKRHPQHQNMQINQLIATQTSQHNTLVHIVSILNITRYATQVNRHSINTLIDAVCTTSQDINNLYNLTTSLATSINFNQMILHIRSVFANLWDSLHYIWMVSTHTMEYINAATSGTLSPHVLPIIDLQKMLQHIADTLPPTLHLPISPEDTLHFYRYLCTHILIENKQFLLLIDVPIQDRACQITVHQVFTLDIPHGNYSACYDVNTKYFGVTKDATMAVELSTTQFQACQQANGQFCHISTPFQPLANLPTCIAALYAKSKTGIASKCSLQICKTTTTNLPTQITPDIWILTTPGYSSSHHHDLNMPQETHGNYTYPTTNTHTEATHGLQCHLIKFLPTP